MNESVVIEGQVVARRAAALSAFIDAGYPATLDREAHLWRRISKVTSEANEARDALEGMLGENFRKGVTHTQADVITELADTAFCALAAIEHLTGNIGESMAYLQIRSQQVVLRAGLET